MHAFLTARRLKPGSYDDWRKAWEPDEWPEGSKRAYILRNVDWLPAPVGTPSSSARAVWVPARSPPPSRSTKRCSRRA